MKVFISWSGEKSRLVALALREWLPWVINDVEPFVSDEDIHSGTRWQSEIAAELEATNFGIICVTRENQEAPWLNFEAGALAKAVDASRVVPLAIDLKLSDVVLPLGQFQAQRATREGIRKVLFSLNASSDHPLDEDRLRKAADKWWSDLEAQLVEIEERTKAPDATSESAERTDRELLEETLDTVRSLARDLETSRRRVPHLQRREDELLFEELRSALDAFDAQADILVTDRPGGIRHVTVIPRKRFPDELRRQLWNIGLSHGINLGIRLTPEERAEQDREGIGPVTRRVDARDRLGSAVWPSPYAV